MEVSKVNHKFISVFRKNKQFWLGIIILSIILLIILYMVFELWKLLFTVQKEVAAAIVVGSATVIVSIISVIAAKYFERKRIIEQELRQKKIPMYEEFAAFWFEILSSQKEGIKTKKKSFTEEEIKKYFIKFTRNLLVWGADEVLIQWNIFRGKFSGVESGENITPDVMFDFEKVLFSIRKDLGHKNINIKRGELLGLFVNDIKKYL
jgi:hypothetical protein